MKTVPTNIQNKKILFATLDWGMGHLTRSTVLMKQFLANGNLVLFAGTRAQCAFIATEFGEIECHELIGYEIKLDSSKNTFFQIVSQFLSIKRAIRTENDWLKTFVNENEIDLIISDNRYGFYHESVESILLTHQLNLQLPQFRAFVNKKLRRWISRFDSVWVPDNKDRSLTGELSNPHGFQYVEFIGPLNRFEKLDFPNKYDVLIILSGPEPERTNFLNKALSYIKSKRVKACIIGAEVDSCDSIPNPTTKVLNELIAKSSTVISRAGYTTIMEMAALDQHSILIPTKGQYEQEYLANVVKHPSLVFQESLLLV